MPAMRRDLRVHFIYWLIFFAAIILIKHYFSLSVILFIIGGLIGVILPDLDHLIYVYFIKPTDLTSQRVNYLMNKSEIMRSVELLFETKDERRDLIFHTIFFQGIFLVLTFLILSSSGSFLGRGLVLSFMLHLSIDQFIDLKASGNMDSWLKNLPFSFDVQQSKLFWILSTSIILLMGFVF